MLVLGSSVQIARKDHRCDSCGKSISIGDAYYRCRCVDGRDAWVWNAHLPCESAGRILLDAGHEGDDGAYLNVIDMDADHKEIIRRADAHVADQIWGPPVNVEGR